MVAIITIAAVVIVVTTLLAAVLMSRRNPVAVGQEPEAEHKEYELRLPQQRRPDWKDYGLLPAPRQETVTNPNKDRSLCGKTRRKARKQARRAEDTGDDGSYRRQD